MQSDLTNMVNLPEHEDESLFKMKLRTAGVSAPGLVGGAPLSDTFAQTAKERFTTVSATDVMAMPLFATLSSNVLSRRNSQVALVDTA